MKIGKIITFQGLGLGRGQRQGLEIGPYGAQASGQEQGLTCTYPLLRRCTYLRTIALLILHY